RTPATTESQSVTEPCFPARRLDFHKRVSKPGSLNPTPKRPPRPDKGTAHKGIVHDDDKTDLNDGVPYVDRSGTQECGGTQSAAHECASPRSGRRGQGSAALLERSRRLSRQRRADDHRGVSAGQLRP